MTKDQLILRIQRVKGLTVVDPWGTRARVDRLDGDYAWLAYNGIAVLFRRSLDSLVRATNGELVSDKSGQFLKRISTPWGMITLEFEPFWESDRAPSVAHAQPTIESLRRERSKLSKRR